GRVPSPGSPPPAAGAPATPSAPAHSPSGSAAVAAAAWCPRVGRHSLAGDGLRHRVVGQELHLDRVLGQRTGGDRTYGLAFTRPVPSDVCRTRSRGSDHWPSRIDSQASSWTSAVSSPPASPVLTTVLGSNKSTAVSVSARVQCSAPLDLRHGGFT